jgi:glycosyltransferase involved in cell wall biosynthesis
MKVVLFRSHRAVPDERLTRFFARDMYALILRQALALGRVDEAHVVIPSDVEQTQTIDRLMVHQIRTYRRLPAAAREGDVLFVREEHASIEPALRQARFRGHVFYAANKNLTPRRMGGFDVVLVDDERHFDRVRRKCPGAEPMRMVKTTDPAWFHPLPAEPKRWDLCCFGHMTAPKNYAALPPILAELADCRVVVVGRPEPELYRRLEQAGPPIECTGALEAAEANRILNRSRIGLILSEHDGAPRTLVESMAAGLPQLVNARLVTGLDYIGPRVGRIAPLEDFPAEARRMLAAPEAFDPAAEFRRRYAPEHAAAALADAFDRAARRRGHPPSVARRRFRHARPTCLARYLIGKLR